MATETAVDYRLWDGLLRRAVTDGAVDYLRLQRMRSALEAVLRTFAAVDPAQLPSREARLAFWINGYNACVVKGVLDHYPLTSVRDVKGFFDTIRYEVGGASLTLNEIEANGRALGEWRFHFAVVCASSSCPPLRPEAYTAERLEAQLADQMRHFLADPRKGLRVESGQALWVSKIFKWYATDIVPNGRLSAESLLQVLRVALDPAVADAIGAELRTNNRLKVGFLDYDWTLNEQAR